MWGLDRDGFARCRGCGVNYQPDDEAFHDPDASWPNSPAVTTNGSQPTPDQPPTTRRLVAVRPHLRASLLTVSGLATLPPVRPLIDGLLYRGTPAQLSGPPGSYKSFTSVGMACAVAAGVPFEGHAVPEGGGPVVYVAAEGANGLQARILAWCELTNIDPVDLEGKLYVLPLPVQLGNWMDVADAVEITRELGAVLIVLDTRARCTVGLEENSNTEQGRAIAALETLIHDTDCAALVVHHSGRSGLNPRGANAWDGAVWSDLRLTGDNLHCKLNCFKHKDIPDGCDHEFRLIPHTVSDSLMPEATEAQRQTLVLVAGDGRPDTDDAPSVTSVAEIIRECDGIEGLTRPQIITLAADRGVSRSQAYAAVKTLIERGQVRNVSATRTPRYVASRTTLPVDVGDPE
ncbi:AAA family ATPase [Pseudonocardia sulfidoxydans]|uniref:AAA family ATPase n=1 Tax=Pseudonocardia sulfidoxydans TaxID=54011 RepID=UPI001C99CCEA|nr:AAA family ATPase [Pseudonocardia sulfidoxydans]